jgi:hypothetical protein
VVAEFDNGVAAALFDNEFITIIMCLAKKSNSNVTTSMLLDGPMLYKPCPESPDSPRNKELKLRISGAELAELI